ncbi:uncharacterized protein LOC141917292 isoform X2 [Strix aluco]|uniref:uncharacterized protein LOC141917292 isoform X2 n=1 Tax=Strix aluco TaxID=111821 RepID=UPI003DA5CD0F
MVKKVFITSLKRRMESSRSRLDSWQGRGRRELSTLPTARPRGFTHPSTAPGPSALIPTETLQTAPSLLCGHLKRLLACLQFSPTLRVICYNSVLVSAGIELIFLSWEGVQPECQAQTGHWSVPYPVTLCSGYKAELEAVVEATTGWLETYPVSHVTARNTILGLEERVLWRHGTPERIESDNGTHFRHNLIDAWAEEHGIEWVYHIPYHAPASGKIERYNGLLKTTLRAMGGWNLQTLGHTSDKGHLVSQHKRICQSSWSSSVKTPTCCRRG